MTFVIKRFIWIKTIEVKMLIRFEISLQSAERYFGVRQFLFVAYLPAFNSACWNESLISYTLSSEFIQVTLNQILREQARLWFAAFYLFLRFELPADVKQKNPEGILIWITIGETCGCHAGSIQEPCKGSTLSELGYPTDF